MTAAALIALIEGIVSLEPAAQQLWTMIQPFIGTSGAEPTAEQWTAINALRDQAHAAVQAS